MKTQTKSARSTKTANLVTTRATANSVTIAMDVIDAYNSGVSIARIATRYSFGQDAVRTLLVANKVTIRGRGRYPASVTA